MFLDALTDTATFKTISYSQNSLGEEVKNEVVLYTSIPVRLHLSGSRPVVMNDAGKYESFSKIWTMQAQPQYNGANRGDRVETEGNTFLIVQKDEIRGRGTAIHHVVYYLEEIT